MFSAPSGGQQVPFDKLRAGSPHGLKPSVGTTVVPTEGFSPCGEPALSLSKGTCCPPEGALNIVLAETEDQASLSEVLRAHKAAQSLTLAVGPEGGWADDELQLFANWRWIGASLGDTILRAETAAIAALAIARSVADG